MAAQRSSQAQSSADLVVAQLYKQEKMLRVAVRRAPGPIHVLAPVDARGHDGIGTRLGIFYRLGLLRMLPRQPFSSKSSRISRRNCNARWDSEPVC